MSYGWDERREFEKLRSKYPVPPSLIYGYREYFPEDYLRFLELEKLFAPRTDPKELRKNTLTDEARTAEGEKRYMDAAEQWMEIAAICHQQGSAWERDAYLVEHRAMQCRHMEVYKNARISIRSFRSFKDVPNLDKLQDALTLEAEKTLTRQEYAMFTVCNLLNARLCHAQGKEYDAFLLEESTKKYNFFEQYFVQPGGSSKNPAVEEMVLRQIAKDYDSILYPA